MKSWIVRLTDGRETRTVSVEATCETLAWEAAQDLGMVGFVVLDAKPVEDRVYISANSTDESMWHLSRQVESRGARTGRVLATYRVTICSGSSLAGNGYGHSERASLPPMAVLCKRCAKIEDRQAQQANADGDAAAERREAAARENR